MGALLRARSPRPKLRTRSEPWEDAFWLWGASVWPGASGRGEPTGGEGGLALHFIEACLTTELRTDCKMS